MTEINVLDLSREQLILLFLKLGKEKYILDFNWLNLEEIYSFLQGSSLTRIKKYVNEENKTANILVIPESKIPTRRQLFYQPGYCFQKKYKTYWCHGFEYRYARRNSIRAYLGSIERLNKKYEISIGPDISSYILSFLLPRDIGREIKVRNHNENITKKKNYLELISKINYCRVGHNFRGPYTCRKCADLYSTYLMVKCQIDIAGRPREEEMPRGYSLLDGYDSFLKLDDRKLNRMKLELEIIDMNHKFKMSRLKNRAVTRLRNFQNC